MPNDRLYFLDRIHVVSPDYGMDFSIVSEKTRGPAPQCPLCGAWVGLLTWQPPFVADLEVFGSDYGDVAYGPGDALLLTERVWRLLQKEKLKGLCDYAPVQVRRVRFRGKRLGPHPPYGRVTVTRVRQAMDVVASKVAYSRPPTCPECRSGVLTRVDGLVLEPGPLPKEDVFTVRGLSGIVVATTRFKEFCARHGVKNANLVPAEELHFDWTGSASFRRED